MTIGEFLDILTDADEFLRIPTTLNIWEAATNPADAAVEDKKLSHRLSRAHDVIIHNHDVLPRERAEVIIRADQLLLQRSAILEILADGGSYKEQIQNIRLYAETQGSTFYFKRKDRTTSLFPVADIKELTEMVKCLTYTYKRTRMVGQLSLTRKELPWDIITYIIDML
jgi:hypothetical protein